MLPVEQELTRTDAQELTRISAAASFLRLKHAVSAITNH